MRSLSRLQLFIAAALAFAVPAYAGLPGPRAGGVTGLTGNGTVLTATVPYLAPAGSCADPAIAWALDRDGTGSGWFRQAANVWSLCLNGVEVMRFTTTEARFIVGTLWNRTYRDTGGNQRLDFGATSTNTYLSQASASSIAHSHESQTTNTSGLLDRWCAGNGSGCVTSFDWAGSLMLDSTDSTASPGAATINKPSGSSAIAAGASSVVITNNLVSATTNIQVTATEDDATCLAVEWFVTKAAGSFTVGVSQAGGAVTCTTATNFDWVITKKS